MCGEVVVGDFYRGCGHFLPIYEPGIRNDCLSPLCGLSSAHIHKAPRCPCPKTTEEDRRVQNLFQKACDKCRGAEFDRRVGRSQLRD